MRKVGSQEIIDDDEKVVLNDQPLSFFKLLSYADAVDYTLMAFASLGSVIHGLAQPLGYLLLGKAINAFGNNINDDVAMVKALKKVIPFVWYMAFATFPAGVIGEAFKLEACSFHLFVVLETTHPNIYIRDCKKT
ncbi:putative Type I protein exporter [Helianthus anomalus]